MDRLFLDANVLFSAAYGSRGLRTLWDMAEQKKCCLLTSVYAAEEVRRNLDHPEHLSRLKSLLEKVEIVAEPDPSLQCPVSLPEKDRPIILAAIQAGATHLITGDLRHFEAYYEQSIQGVLICTPRDYLTKLSKAER